MSGAAVTDSPWFADLAPESDGLHVAGSDQWWREAWYFELYDPNVELQFQAYQGVFPNAATGDLNAAIFHRRRLIHVTSKTDFHVPAEPMDERLCFGPMKLETLEPLQRWRLKYDAPEVQADLLFEAVHPPFSWAAAKLWLETSAQADMRSHHFDQLGRYTGTIWVDETALAIDTLGFRDRMWGWGGRKHWRSYVILWSAFDEGCIANLAIQRFDDGRQALAGYLLRDGQPSLLRRAAVEVEWNRRRWKTIARVDAEVEDSRGRMLQFSGRPQGVLDTSHRWAHRSDHMLFSVGEYQCGDRVGHGVMNWAFANEAERPHELEAWLESSG
jgi:hypothetical protein